MTIPKRISIAWPLRDRNRLSRREGIFPLQIKKKTLFAGKIPNILFREIKIGESFNARTHYCNKGVNPSSPASFRLWSSSTAERPAVNRRVVGSNPTSRAILLSPQEYPRFLVVESSINRNQKCAKEKNYYSVRSVLS